MFPLIRRFLCLHQRSETACCGEKSIKTMSSGQQLKQGHRPAAEHSTAMDTEDDSPAEEQRQHQQQQQKQQQRHKGKGRRSPQYGASSSGEDDDEPSSGDDGNPENIPSNTLRAAPNPRANDTAHSTSDDSYGKRKADDFLRRQALAMDPHFKAVVVLPGDDVTESTTRSTRNLRLGPGLVQRADKVSVTRAGVLRYRPPCSYWVESNGRRYCARVEDQVLGIVEDRMGESYKVNIFGT